MVGHKLGEFAPTRARSSGAAPVEDAAAEGVAAMSNTETANPTARASREVRPRHAHEGASRLTWLIVAAPVRMRQRPAPAGRERAARQGAASAAANAENNLDSIHAARRRHGLVR